MSEYSSSSMSDSTCSNFITSIGCPIVSIMACCDMKGYLSYLILWILGKKKMKGAEIARELEKRRGTMPTPGTIYPALKELKEKGMIAADESKTYSLTKKGEKEMKAACSYFTKMFYDVKDMFDCCK